MTQVKNGAATDVATFSNQKALPKTKAILNQVVADLYTAQIAFPQVHWYRGGAPYLFGLKKWSKHGKTLDATLDEVSERLITLGGKPYSTLTEFIQHSKIEEKAGEFSKNVEESLARVIEIFRYLINVYQEALDVTDEEGDDVTNDIFVGAKADLEKTIWMLTAEIGQAPGL